MTTLMKVGGIGCILWIIGIITAMLMTFEQILGMIGMGIVSAGIILTAIGALGLWKHYKNTMPLITGIIGIIAGILLLTGLLLPEVAGIEAAMTTLYLILTAVAVLAVFLIMLGVTFTMLKDVMGTAAALPAGILSTIVGATGAIMATGAGGSITGLGLDSLGSTGSLLTGLAEMMFIIGIIGMVPVFAMLITNLMAFFKAR